MNLCEYVKARGLERPTIRQSIGIGVMSLGGPNRNGVIYSPESFQGEQTNGEQEIRIQGRLMGSILAPPFDYQGHRHVPDMSPELAASLADWADTGSISTATIMRPHGQIEFLSENAGRMRGINSPEDMSMATVISDMENNEMYAFNGNLFEITLADGTLIRTNQFDVRVAQAEPSQAT